MISTQNDSSQLRHQIKYQLKCVMLGCSGSGKSSIVRRYIMDDFINNMDPSIGAAFDFKYLQTEHGVVKLDVWDTAGQERFNSIMPLYYKRCDIAVIVYDTTSHDTFMKAKTWITRIRRETEKEPMFILVGNKVDLGNHVFIEEAKQYARENNMVFYECSAKTGQNVQDIFNVSCYEFISKSISNNNQNETAPVPAQFESNKTIKLENNLLTRSPQVLQKYDYISSCMNVIKTPLEYIRIFNS